MKPFRAPKPILAPAPCPWCGAHTEQEANGRCQQKGDETGEYSCPTTDIETDAAGRFLFETPASLAALDAAIAAHMALETIGGERG